MGWIYFTAMINVLQKSMTGGTDLQQLIDVRTSWRVQALIWQLRLRNFLDDWSLILTALNLDKSIWTTSFCRLFENISLARYFFKLFYYPKSKHCSSINQVLSYDSLQLLGCMRNYRRLWFLQQRQIIVTSGNLRATTSQ